MKKTILSFSILLAACGGGGGNSSTSTLIAAGPTATPVATPSPTNTPAPSISPVSIWKEVHTESSNANSLEETAAVLFENGASMFVAWSNQQLDSMSIGNYSFSNGVLTFTQHKEALPTNMTLTSVSLTGNVSAQGLTVKETGNITGLTLQAVKTNPAVLSDVVGTYSGKSYAGNGPFLGVADGFIVQSDGTITDRALNSCRYTGKLTPSNKMNAYSFTLTFANSGCVLNGATVTGLAFQEPFRNKLIAFGTNTAQTQGLYFEGTR